MYSTLSTPQLNFSNAFRCKSVLSTTCQYLSWERCKSTWRNNSKHISLNYQFHQKQISKATESQVARGDVSQLPDTYYSTAQTLEVVKNIGDSIEHVKKMLSSMDDGRISVSPYDTAWIALIPDLEGRNVPQFPSSLDWIAQHQLSDGSWGDEQFFCAYDRLLNTLACVVALRSWNVHDNKSEKGISYIKENVCKLEDANAEHMTCGFEVVFPALLQRARNMGIDDIPYDAPVVKQIYNARDRKIERIPMELVHKVPTSLLYSLEGLENLDWEKLLKLQSADGSFLTSPSSTAFAFMQTKDENCFKFIKNTVEKFNGGAPHAYPVDLFARLWAVDRLQRLGISRFFESEIADCLSHIYRFWTEKGIFSARETEFCEIDDTSMGFRLLRLHGYDVDPNVFMNFKTDNKFSCQSGQMIESPSPIYNLYRASQIRFSGEEILEEANNFSYEFLQDRLTSNNPVLDKWVISKHLPDEIRFGLEMPWYATLPRVESRYYLQHYGGANDVWIGKSLYRMQDVSNDTYLELARLDFNRCQAQHQIEWLYMQEWYENYSVQEFGISRKDLLIAYFLATASVFEPERTKERIAWVKSQIVSRMITYFFNKEATSLDHKTALLAEFRNNINGLSKTQRAKTEERLVNILLKTLHQLLEGFDKYLRHQLKNAWSLWLMKLHQGEAEYGAEAELLVTTLNICAGYNVFKEDILPHHEYTTLSNLTNKICQQLSQIQNKKVVDMKQDMQELVKLVLEKSVGIDRNIKQTFLSVAKTFYYSACYEPETIDIHIFKVLFEPVL